MAEPGPVGRKKLFIVSAVVVLLVAGGGLLGLAEWFVRSREVSRSAPPGLMPGLFYQHESLRTALVRDFDYYGWVHINRLGFRGADFEAVKTDSVFRILAIGGSTTFDRGVSADERAWPAVLEGRLNGSRDGTRYQVINAGVPGYRVLDNMIRLQSELLSLEPDLIILYEGHNDIFHSMQRGGEKFTPRPMEVRTVTPWGSWLHRHSLLYGKVRERLGSYMIRRAARRPLPTFRQRLADGVARFRTDLTSMAAIASAHKVRVVLPRVVFAHGDGPALAHYWARAMPFVSPADVPAIYEAYNSVISEVGETWGFDVVDTAPFGLDGPEFYEEGDPIHFNDAGAERMGVNMASALAPLLQEIRTPRSQ